MSRIPENPGPGTQPGTTRIVAGETGKPNASAPWRSPWSRASCS